MIQESGIPTYNQLFSVVLDNPLNDAKFLFPVAVLVIISMAMKHYSKKSTLTSPPSFEQKREKFLVPVNSFNMYISRVNAMDDQYFLNEVDVEIQKLKDLQRAYEVTKKKYFSVLRKIRGSQRYRTRKGDTEKKKLFSEILAIYEEIRKTKMRVVEVETRNE